jgi:arylsulfatase A-like enzyme
MMSILAICLGMAAASMPPHIMHLVIYVVGHNDIGYANAKMVSLTSKKRSTRSSLSDSHVCASRLTHQLTPNIDALAEGGVKIERYYTFKECAPTRGSMLTGRLPFHFGYYRNPNDEGGINLNYTLLPAVLASKGYQSYGIGKWHLGFKTKSYTATYRGFSEWFGYYHWGEGYWQHEFPPAYKGAVKCRGVDLNNNSGTEIRSVGNQYSGVYSSYLFVQEAARMINNHPKDKPFYMYAAFQNNHDPYEVPKVYADMYPSLPITSTRRNFSGMISALDDAVGNLTVLLKDNGMWDNCVVITTSDNGGELPYYDGSGGGAGDNQPLR